MESGPDPVVLCGACFEPKPFGSKCRNKQCPSFQPIGEISVDVPQAICDAIVETRKICRRERVKADRIEAVGHFVTCLRRMLRFVPGWRNYTRDGQSSQWLINNLTKKAVWHDVGILSSNFEAYIGRSKDNIGHGSSNISCDQIAIWVGEANIMAGSKEPEPIDEIQYDLSVLESSLGYFSGQQKRVDGLLERADELADELADAVANL
jgi:hypothetical protein